jgi:hypothetical protein
VFRIRDILVRIRIYGSGSTDPDLRFLIYGSGSTDPDLRIRICGSVPQSYGPDSDPDPVLFVSDLQDAKQNSRNQGFSYFFCLIEGSGSESGSVLLTNGSGSGRPKNLRIFRIGIQKTAMLYWNSIAKSYRTWKPSLYTERTIPSTHYFNFSTFKKNIHRVTLSI